jgi:choline/ethanolamine kinase
MGEAKDLVNNKEIGVTQIPLDNKISGVENDASDKKNYLDCLQDEAKVILKSIASKWKNVLDANALEVIPLKGAMTNEVFQIKWQTIDGEMSRKVLVRIYGEGTNIFFDRANEIRTFEFISKNGQGPRLLGRFAQGRVEEFIRARVILSFSFCHC